MTVDRPLRRLLVANRGEIALRVMRTARSLGVQTVAIHSDPDVRAPFVRFADRAVRLPGSASVDTYLDGEAVITAALATGADAVHPGYGFLSENPAFARAVIDAGLIWVGPRPESIEAMALKVEAKRLAAKAGVPLAPGAELDAGMDAATVARIAADVGYPVLVKASAGGGGRGMRIVATADELLDAVASARREAAAAFGDDTVFLEAYLADARHVEVQVFGDEHGTVVHLLERECSIQRRHQKVVEEAPSPGVTDAVRAQLHAAAVALAAEIGYVGAGTVEFLVFGDGVEQRLCFLEMNTRLQVEHRVTEAVLGVDLVAWQLAVAAGLPLPMRQDEIVARGHAIEVRLYAEDPARDYAPSVGEIHRFAVDEEPGIVVDAGVDDGTVVSPHYDAMIAKVIASADDRTTAARRLAGALRRARLHGPPTNRDSLVAILEDADFISGATTTAFLDRHRDVLDPATEAADATRHAVAVAAVLQRAAESPVGVPAGWRNVPAVPEFVSLRRRGEASVVTILASRDGYALARTDDAPFATAVTLAGETIPATVTGIDPDADGTIVTVTLGGVSARCRVARYSDSCFVDDGFAASAFEVLPRFADHSHEQSAGGQQASVPGTVTAVLVAVGDEVVAGQTLVLLEAMKMEHRIVAAADGVVMRIHVEPGSSVAAHEVVIDIDQHDSGGTG